jgi:hypothetical protein
VGAPSDVRIAYNPGPAQHPSGQTLAESREQREQRAESRRATDDLPCGLLARVHGEHRSRHPTGRYGPNGEGEGRVAPASTDRRCAARGRHKKQQNNKQLTADRDRDIAATTRNPQPAGGAVGAAHTARKRPRKRKRKAALGLGQRLPMHAVEAFDI